VKNLTVHKKFCVNGIESGFEPERCWKKCQGESLAKEKVGAWMHRQRAGGGGRSKQDVCDWNPKSLSLRRLLRAGTPNPSLSVASF